MESGPQKGACSGYPPRVQAIADMVTRLSPAGCVHVVLLATWLLGACAAGSEAAPRNATFPRQRETDMPSAPATAPPGANAPIAASFDFAHEADALGAAVRQTEPLAIERSLRQELATAEDPTASALELAGFLAAEERHEEALAVVQQAETRSQDPRLRVARAGLQRDLGRRHLALAELETLVRERGAKALHPGLLFEVAELNWLEGDGAQALAKLREIEQVHGDDPWCVDHQQQLSDLAAEIQRGRGPQRVRVVDLLGNLRGAPSASTRIAVLEQLARGAAGGEEATGELRARAVAIASADAAPVVRARAVQLARPSAETAEEFCEVALADDATIVRQFAAARAVELLGPASATLLLDCLAREEDPATFATLHEALKRCGRTAPQLPVGGGETAEGRQQIVAAWREQWRR
jgi:hypothetical protein